MENQNDNKILDTSSAFLDNTFSSLDLNLDMEKIYELINDEELNNEFEHQINLTNLRNDNYNRYKAINITKYKNLPLEFEDIKEDILNFYDCINVKNILTDNYEDSKNNKVVLDSIYVRISRLDNMIKTYLKDITKNNNIKQKEFNMQYFKNLNIDEKLKKDLIQKYNDLVLLSSKISNDIYEELEIQKRRKLSIEEILKVLNIGKEVQTRLLTQDRLKPLNNVINSEISKYKDKIQYLEDLMIEKSKHSLKFIEFKNFFNKLIAYDDTNYENARQIFDILVNDDKLKNNIKDFEHLFIDEREKNLKEMNFVYEKVGIKNLINSFNYIVVNYIKELSEKDINILNYISSQINGANYNINELNMLLKGIVTDIWKNQITDVYSFNPKEDFYFICSNNQFIDEKYQTILITKKELERVTNYEDYQIGFICEYNNNIMYITENEDIMTVSMDDMSYLKTPLQVEQEFMNFKVCNRIALNGYKTKIQAVYYINDGNEEKYMKALELANMYKLPLIELKK